MKRLVLLFFLFVISETIFCQNNLDFDSNWQTYSRQGLGSDQQDIGAVYGKLDLDYRVIVQGEIATIKIRLTNFIYDSQNAYNYPPHGRTYTLDALNKLGVTTSRYNTEVITNYRADAFEAVEAIFECSDGNHIRTATIEKGIKTGDEWSGPFQLGSTYSLRIPLKYADKEKFYECFKNSAIRLKNFLLTGGTQQTNSKYINNILNNPNEVDSNSKSEKTDDYLNNTEEQVQNSDASAVDIKKPYEYSKKEWEGMNKDEQQASLRYQLNKINEPESISQKNQINEQLQKQGNRHLANGDFSSAFQVYSSAGDNMSAMIAGTAGLINSITERSKEKRENKKILRQNNIKSQLSRIENLHKQILDDNNFVDEFILKGSENNSQYVKLLNHFDKRIQLLGRLYNRDFIREIKGTENEIKIDNLRFEIQKAYINDITKSLNAKFINFKQRLHLYAVYNLFDFISNNYKIENAIDDFKKLELNEKTQLICMMFSISEIDYRLLNIYDYNRKILPKEKESKTFKSIMDKKILNFLKNGLGYHFYVFNNNYDFYFDSYFKIDNKTLLREREHGKISFKRKAFGYFETSKELKKLIKIDEKEKGLTYEELLNLKD